MLRSESRDDIPQCVRELYDSSFPDEERIPYGNLERTFGCGGDLEVFTDDGRFVGFCYSFEHDGIVFLVYIATVPECRGRGYGKEMLDRIRSIKDGRVVFLVLEGSDSDDPADIRNRRRNFYLRNGCTDTGFRVLSDDVYFDSMFVQGGCPEETVDRTVRYYEDLHNGRITCPRRRCSNCRAGTCTAISR